MDSKPLDGLSLFINMVYKLSPSLVSVGSCSGDLRVVLASMLLISMPFMQYFRSKPLQRHRLLEIEASTASIVDREAFCESHQYIWLGEL